MKFYTIHTPETNYHEVGISHGNVRTSSISIHFSRFSLCFGWNLELTKDGLHIGLTIFNQTGYVQVIHLS